MKINRIRLNCRSDVMISTDRTTDSALFYFKSPVIFTNGDLRTKLPTGSAVIFNNGTNQSFSPINGNSIRYDMISFRISSSDRQYITSMNLPFNTPIIIKDDFVISSTFKSMKSRSLHKSRYMSEFMELSMRLILIILSEAHNGTESDPTEDIPRYAELKALRESIYDDPMNQWLAEEISEDMGISKTYFHRIYLSAFGVTCRQDVIESRLLFAADLLKNTDLSVSAIAEQCGYDSDSYFMRQFKQHKGCTPSEYRRRTAEYQE